MKYWLLPLAALLAHPMAYAQMCEANDQFIVIREGDVQKMKRCTSGPVGTKLPDGFAPSDLLGPLEQYKNDPKFIASMKQVGLGKNYGEIKNTLATFQGRVSLNGDAADAEALKYVSQKLNEDNGVTARLKQEQEFKLSEREEKAKRENTPVNFDENELKAAAEQNSNIAKNINAKNCDSSAKHQDESLRVYKVTFADKEEAILLPLRQTKNADGSYKVQMQEYGTGFGGLQVTTKSGTRTLKIENGKTIWVGKNGTEYPIEKMTRMKSSEALGLTRPMGWGSRADACLWAENFNAPAASSAGGPAGTPAGSDPPSKASASQ